MKKKVTSKKKFSEETIKMIYIGSFITLFIAFMVLIGIYGKNNDIATGNKMMEDYEVALKSEETTLLYLGRKTCLYCGLLNDLLEEFKLKYELKYLYLDTEKIPSEGFSKILSDLKIDTNTFGTPYLVAIKKGVVVEALIGYQGEESTMAFFKKYGNIPSDAETTLNYIDYATFKQLHASTKNEVVVIGSTSCTYCQQARPILNKISEEQDVIINYININLISKESDYNEIIALLNKEYGKGEWGTPATVIVKNNKIVDTLHGLSSESVTIEFLKRYNIIE